MRTPLTTRRRLLPMWLLGALLALGLAGPAAAQDREVTPLPEDTSAAVAANNAQDDEPTPLPDEEPGERAESSEKQDDDAKASDDEDDELLDRKDRGDDLPDTGLDVLGLALLGLGLLSAGAALRFTAPE